MIDGTVALRRKYIHPITATLLGVLLLMACSSLLMAKGLVEFSPALLNNVETKFGKSAVLRLKALTKLVGNNQAKGEMEKVKLVNDLFNQIPYYTDIVHWRKDDYWATPFEKLTTNGGDCEDYSIAKYYTLLELGVPDKKLRIMYVKAINWGEAHMILAYFPSSKSIPLVLDNINPKIFPANKRKDLIPVYSFNGNGLWLAKGRGAGKRVGSSSRLKLWTDLKRRVKK